MEEQRRLDKVNLNRKCANPFGIHKKSITASLRRVKKEDIETPGLSNNLFMGSKVCSTCQKKLQQKRKQEGSVQDSSKSSGSTNSSEGEEVEPGPSTSCAVQFMPEQSEEVSQSLRTFGESPVDRKKMKASGPYARQKTEKAVKSLVKTFQFMTPHKVKSPSEKPMETEEEKSVGDEIMEQLKEKYQQCTTRHEKFLVLTTVPRSWTIDRIRTKFEISTYMAKEAKKLQKTKGIMSAPAPRTGRKCADDVIQNVLSFYRSDEISRLMPGKKDCISVRQGKQKVQMQKRLILCNLKEAYQAFRAKYPSQNIGFSKFADLRPKECVLAGASGTHSVCVCTIHQNVKLMILGSKLDKITSGMESELKNYSDCLAKIVCDQAEPNCHLGACEV